MYKKCSDRHDFNNIHARKQESSFRISRRSSAKNNLEANFAAGLFRSRHTANRVSDLPG